MSDIHIRFYGPLKDFLPLERKGRRFTCSVKGEPSIKDTIEALGVPHTAVEAIRVNRQNQDFYYQIKDNDHIDVYPHGTKHHSLKRLLPPPKVLHFVVDSHLGKLARSLRLLGFDTVYKNVFPDKQIASLAVRQKRILLTRDLGLLKYKKLVWGYWVRSTNAQKQIKEVMGQYQLDQHLKPFTRCLECNGFIQPVLKTEIKELLPPKVRKYYTRFYRCKHCQHIYWRGSHYKKLKSFVRKIGYSVNGRRA
jgi:uncharacterized protein with PIN domain